MGEDSSALDAVALADRRAVDAALLAFCDELVPSEAYRPVADAIRYSVGGGGKRLRALLLLAAYRATGGSGDAHPLAAAVEMVHAYSLIHDDLPCMDDDDVRRGRPTVHRAFTVAVATVAGMAMVPLASRCVFRATRALDLPGGLRSQILRELLRAAGAGGMIGGQLLDLEGEGRDYALPELEAVHRGKTGMLISASLRIGAMAARAPADAIDALARYGLSLGLAFQITDDVLDVTATSGQLGKTAGKDSASRKSTYPSLLGVDRAAGLARELAERGRAVLRDARLDTPELTRLSRYVVERRS